METFSIGKASNITFVLETLMMCILGDIVEFSMIGLFLNLVE